MKLNYIYLKKKYGYVAYTYTYGIDKAGQAVVSKVLRILKRSASLSYRTKYDLVLKRKGIDDDYHVVCIAGNRWPKEGTSCK